MKVRSFFPFFCHKFNIEKHPNYKYLEDSDKKNAYLIDDLHTEKAPDLVENYTEKVSLAKPEYDEAAITDLEMPDDDELMEMADMDKPKITLEEEFEQTSTDRLFTDEEPDFSDEELPNIDEMSAFDMSELSSFGEEFVFDEMF